MSKPNPRCPACGKRGQKFRWSGISCPPITISCPHCDWLWRAHGIELKDGCGPWNTFGHPQAKFAREWAEMHGINHPVNESPEADKPQDQKPQSKAAEGDVVNFQPHQKPRSRWAVGRIMKKIQGEDELAYTVEIIDPLKSGTTPGERFTLYDHWIGAVTA